MQITSVCAGLLRLFNRNGPVIRSCSDNADCPAFKGRA